MSSDPCYGWLVPIGTDGTDVGAFQLKRQLYVIGSAEGVNIRIPYKGIHPWHCAVVIDSSHLVHVRNLHQSRYFTVNGVHVPSMTQVNHLDIIQFRKHSLRYEGPHAAPPHAGLAEKPVTEKASTRKPKKSSAPKPKTSKEVPQTPFNKEMSLTSFVPPSDPPQPSSPTITSTMSNISTHSMDVSHVEYEKKDQEVRDYVSALATLITPVPLPSTTQSLEVDASNILAGVMAGGPIEEAVKVGINENGDDEELFFSQEPVKPSQPRNSSFPTSFKPNATHEGPENDDMMLPSSGTTSATLSEDYPRSSSPTDAHEHVLPILKPNNSAKSTSALKRPIRSEQPPPTSRSTRTPAKTRSSLKTSSLLTSTQLPTHMNEEGPRPKKTAKCRREVAVSSSSSFSDVNFTDDLDNSVIVDDEGRERLQPTMAKVATRKTDKNLPNTHHNKTATKKRKPRSIGNDEEVEHAEPATKRAKVSSSSLSSLWSTTPTKPSSKVPTHVLPPPLAEASHDGQTRHIIRQILAVYGSLSHREIMTIANSHEPYASVLRNGAKSNWKMELTARVGDPSFMPELIRQRDLVKLPQE